MRFLLLVALCGLAFAETWKTIDIDRTIDVSSQIVKITALHTLENTGDEAKTVQIALSDDENAHLAYLSAQIDGVKGRLTVSKDAESKNGFKIYTVTLRNPVAKGKQIKLKVNKRLTAALKPLPAKISQLENQFVVFSGNAYVPSVYAVATQKTTVKTTPSGKILSSTAVNPHKQETERVSYGPYEKIAALESKPIKVHYENYSPFVVATLVERTIEVSHWGNIAVEEYIELVHKGAEMKGTFSRLDFQQDRRGRRQPALQQFTTVLPATARDIYYRDEIGNISTSAVRVRAESVDVEIRPRFPLFGGWKTSYVLGYNVPTYEYLHNEGNQYGLKMRVLDHIFENIVVEKLVTKVILPEHVRKVKVITPFPMERLSDEIKPTYLDTTGRLVVIVQKENLVAEHIQPFTLTYEFEFKDMIREPILATAFFFVLFLAVIVYVRFDFSIVSDPLLDAREKLEGRLRELANAVDRKQKLYSKLTEAAANYKQSRDSSLLAEAKKAFESGRTTANEKLSALLASLKKDKNLAGQGPRTAEIRRQKSQQKSAGPEETQFTKKVEESRYRADSILGSL
ncbi:unnamed protein product [Caenorhabditis auriculariae]|uniref:Dolichyl-diphosphooligosaccharide--protein glycosyltransferase subunit 1 n=1 Tax=Caenorhabditis auriculariae TaxID=2777116 RepID=A0A8S1HKH7_9PELO|nr:unnamed protein product [Caenorhabditis auriculariae]